LSDTVTKSRVAIVGAGINGLVAANYLQRAGCAVTMVERAHRVGGACVSEVADIDGVTEHYALGASVLGLMQDFVFEETGLADRLTTYVSEHPKFVFFPGDDEPTWIYRDPVQLDREMAEKWGESGEVEAFREDEDKVVRFLREGYRNARPPLLEEARTVLGRTLTELWISGSARNLIDHYFTAERSKLYMVMTVTESSPVSLDDPYSAFTVPMMDSGSVFGSYYGFVKGGIWQITEELERINEEIGVTTHLSSPVVEVDSSRGSLVFEREGQAQSLEFDHLVLATDPLTAARLVGTSGEIERIEDLRWRGSAGKLNLMFRNPVRWKYGSDAPDSDAAFRFIFSVSSVAEFEEATLKVLDPDVHYAPGYMQIYSEGAAMRQMNHREPFDRVAVFFKNLSLNRTGAELDDVRVRVRDTLFEKIENPEDCVWTRLLMPRDLQQLFLFPGGNLDHTMLTGGQQFDERTFSSEPATDFYRFGALENVYVCGAGTYPSGSIAGTPGYMCSRQLLRQFNS